MDDINITEVAKFSVTHGNNRSLDTPMKRQHF